MASHSFKTAFRSTIVKKFLMALTGLFLVFFVLIHMSGNLLFIVGPQAFNEYSHALISLKPFIYIIEAVLVIAFGVHIWNGLTISTGNKKARPNAYAQLKSAGAPSKKTISSTTMIVTGMILFAFLVIHLISFKFGPGFNPDPNYTAMMGEEPIRDLYKLVKEKFASPLYAFGYIFTMLLLGYHLRHGFWSAFQSLGTNHPKYSGLIYTTGIVLAVVIAFGFLVVPVSVYFKLV